MAKKKNNNLYLSDKPPLTLIGKINLVVSYVLLISWAILIILPLSEMILSSFNGAQEKNIILNAKFVFSLKHFEYLFTKTLFVRWVFNTIYIAVSTAVLTLLVVSFTGYVNTSYTSIWWNSCILYYAPNININISVFYKTNDFNTNILNWGYSRKYIYFKRLS